MTTSSSTSKGTVPPQNHINGFHTNPNCQKCGLFTNCHAPFLGPFIHGYQYDQTVKRPYLVVLEHPTTEDDINAGPDLQCDEWAMVFKSIKASGIALDDCLFTYAVQCCPPNGKLKSVKPVGACRDFLGYQIQQADPKVIISLGGKATLSLLRNPTVADKRMAENEYVHPVTGKAYKTAVTYAPGYILSNRHLERQYVRDFAFAKNLESGKVKQMTGVKYTVDPTPVEWAKFMVGVRKYGWVAFDWEFTNLQTYTSDDWLAMCCVVSTPKMSMVLTFDPAGQGMVPRTPNTDPRIVQNTAFLKEVMSNPSIAMVGHNVKVDRHAQSRRLGIECTGPVYDTEVMHQLLFPVTGGHDLDTVNAELTGRAQYKNMVSVYIKKGEDVGQSYAKIPAPELYQYAAFDGNATATIYEKMRTMITSLGDVYVQDGAQPAPDWLLENFLTPASNALYHVERNGFGFDHKHYIKLASKVRVHIKEVLRELHELPVIHRFNATRRMATLKELAARKRPPKDTVMAQKMADTVFNPNSLPQLRDVLFNVAYYGVQADPDQKTETGGEKTDIETLTAIQQKQIEGVDETYDFIRLHLEYKKFTKIEGTYLKRLADFIGMDRRIHPSFHQTRASTGRLSSSDPNMQNQPSWEDPPDSGLYPIKQIFIGSGPGMVSDPKVILDADYSQIELRVLAAMTQDATLIEIFKTGHDLHDETARSIFQLTTLDPVSKSQRRDAKAVNFGIVYGEGPMGLARDLGISIDQAEAYINAYFERFPGVWEWQNQLKAFVEQKGYVYTLTGRRRLLANAMMKGHSKRERKEKEAAFRAAVNAPIQGTASDMCLASLMDLTATMAHFNTRADVRIMGTVHDSIQAACPEYVANDVASLVKSRMEQAPFELFPHLIPLFNDIPIVVDVECGPSWGELKAIQ